MAEQSPQTPNELPIDATSSYEDLVAKVQAASGMPTPGSIPLEFLGFTDRLGDEPTPVQQPKPGVPEQENNQSSGETPPPPTPASQIPPPPLTPNLQPPAPVAPPQPETEASSSSPATAPAPLPPRPQHQPPVAEVGGGGVTNQEVQSPPPPPRPEDAIVAGQEGPTTAGATREKQTPVRDIASKAFQRSKKALAPPPQPRPPRPTDVPPPIPAGEVSQAQTRHEGSTAEKIVNGIERVKRGVWRKPEPDHTWDNLRDPRRILNLGPNESSSGDPEE